MQHLWIKRTTIRRDAEQPRESRAKQKRSASYFNRDLGCGDHIKKTKGREPRSPPVLMQVTAISSCRMRVPRNISPSRPPLAPRPVSSSQTHQSLLILERPVLGLVLHHCRNLSHPPQKCETPPDPRLPGTARPAPPISLRRCWTTRRPSHVQRVRNRSLNASSPPPAS